nr:putative reverse transcriptase domain-containing protein [Tanacetum cinerariifolium]
MTPESIQAMIDRAIQKNSTYTRDDANQSSGGGLRRPVQPARVCSYTDFMKCQPLNFKGTEGVVGLSQWLEKMESVFHIRSCAIDNQRFQELALMCTKFLTGETEKVDKPKTLDETIELANDLMDQNIRTYAERQNENKRKANDSPRNNQQQPHKKQNIARAYTAGPGEKKVYTGDLPLCTKCNYHHTGQCAPKTHQEELSKTEEPWEWQRKWCSSRKSLCVGGRDASPDSNVITGLAGYYRRFIECFSKIAKSMTKLTQKNVKFDWGEKEEVAFQLIKQKLCSAPILALPKGSEKFIVYCDASHKGLGAVLMQNEKVIAYAS